MFFKTFFLYFVLCIVLTASREHEEFEEYFVNCEFCFLVFLLFLCEYLLLRLTEVIDSWLKQCFGRVDVF